jgi:ERCC4-type nuclease
MGRHFLEGSKKLTLVCDVNEPIEKFLTLVKPVVPCVVEALNENLCADYRWDRFDRGHTQVERKTWGEILANVDAVEDQLRRHMKNQPKDRLLFVLEGQIDPSSDGIYTIQKARGGSVWVRGHRSGTNLGRIYSFLYNASEYVEVFQTPSYEGTCQFLVQAYKQDQKEEHHTFSRYFKKVTFYPNPQVMQLMGLLPGLGEVKCEALIAKFTTVWNVLNASPWELQSVEGIGPKLSTNLLRRIGRTDV